MPPEMMSKMRLSCSMVGISAPVWRPKDPINLVFSTCFGKPGGVDRGVTRLQRRHRDGRQHGGAGPVGPARAGFAAAAGQGAEGIRVQFEAAAGRSLETRMRYAFIRTYKPVLDDAPFRAFDTMEDYRQWCEENLPDWLGYGRV